LLGLAFAGASHAETVGRRQFSDRLNPPAYAPLDELTQARVDLGHSVFNTQWVPAGTEGAGRRAGLGPLFNAAACDACHNDGAHGRGPAGDGPAPVALVIELGSGDPRYGRTLNSAAIEGFAPEASVSIQYESVQGRYPDGTAWQLRSPHYLLSNLRYGSLDAHTPVQPRLAPALFGIGLLEAVPGIHGARFGWQGTSISIRDQTAKAFARDMGLTSSDVPITDCTAFQSQCLAEQDRKLPEVSPELLEAVLEFQRTLAVPIPSADGNPDRQLLFEKTGCAACHLPSLPVVLQRDAARDSHPTIEAYTDLKLHELGPALADRDVSGRPVVSRWRTAPLWGLAYRLKIEHSPTFLHDGRARSVEEAILWHAGEGMRARRNFEALPQRQRTDLLRWVEGL
jgi:CxxC motif-containing protein (DUF1111 family)